MRVEIIKDPTETRRSFKYFIARIHAQSEREFQLVISYQTIAMVIAGKDELGCLSSQNETHNKC